MKFRSTLFSVAMATSLWASSSTLAQAQTTASFPYGKEWVGNSYQPKNELWLSAGIVVAHRPSPGTDITGPRNQIIYGIEARYHFNPRVALMTGVHFGGNTEELEWEEVAGGATSDTSSLDESDYDYYLPDVDQVYREVYWQVGVDFGLVESKYFHIQAGPRLGVQSASAVLESDNDSMLDSLDTKSINATGLFTGAAFRVGAFVAPSVELGLHLQADYTIGKELAGFGREMGGYLVSHF